MRVLQTEVKYSKRNRLLLIPLLLVLVAGYTTPEQKVEVTADTAMVLLLVLM